MGYKVLRKNAISQAVNKMGKFILLHQGTFSWDECLALYRSNDVVEKGFDVRMILKLCFTPEDKQQLEGLPLRLFPCLDLRMKLSRMM